MKQKIRTTPNLADTSPAHQQAIADGDKHFSAWQYNVADHFKGMTVEAIRQKLKETAMPFAILMENIIGDYNLGVVIRNANAFNAQEVFYVGNKKRDKRSEVGVSNYTDVIWLSSVEELVKLNERYTFVAVDNVPGSVSISSYSFPQAPLFFFGEEGVGLTPTLQKLCKETIHIDQHGSVRSLNVGVASGIICYEFVKQYMTV